LKQLGPSVSQESSVRKLEPDLNMMLLPVNGSDAPRRQRKVLCERIFQAFPDVVYGGSILAGGDQNAVTSQPFNMVDLLHSLKDKCWTQIQPEFIERQLGSFIHLTAGAFAAYIPAWLLYSLSHDNRGAEFVAYTFAPDDAHGKTVIRPLSVEMCRALAPSQRRALLDFLLYQSEYLVSDAIADRAAAAVDAVASLIAIFEPGPA
jgi:hypothetical protein